MSLSNIVVRETYVGDGSNTTFAIPFAPIADDSSETLVYLRDETDPSNITEDLLTEGEFQDYTLTGALTPEDFHTDVEFNTAPAAGKKVVIIRHLPLTQLLDLGVTSNWSYEVAELTFDKVVALIQQVNERVNRALLWRITSSRAGDTLPDPGAGSFLRFKEDGTGFEWVDVEGLADAEAINQDISDLEGRVDVVEEDVSSLEDSVSDIEGRVDTAEEDIESLEGSLSDHINEATDAHAASAISNTPAGSIEATDVQGAINELDTDLTSHTNNTSNPHSVTAAQVGNDVAQWNANQLQGRAIDTTAPEDGQGLKWNAIASRWEPGQVASSGGTGINYMIDGDFEDSGATPIAPVGTGMLAEKTTEVGEVLADSTSFKITKLAEDASGTYCPFASREIDPAYRGSKLIFEMIVNASASDYVSGDFKVEAVDHLGNPLAVVGIDDGIYKSQYPVQCGVHTNPDTERVTIRLIIPTDNATSDTYDVFIDNLRLGPGGAVLFKSDGPVGEIIALGTTETPEGFLYCDGTAVSRTQYADLFAAIGTSFGEGDGSTTFNLPDLRGYFLRGYDDGAGVDSGRALGSTQQDAFQGHYHNYSSNMAAFQGGGSNEPSQIAGSRSYATFVTSNFNVTSPKTDGTNGTPRTGTETRPKNVAVAYFIRYKSKSNVMGTTEAMYQTARAELLLDSSVSIPNDAWTPVAMDVVGSDKFNITNPTTGEITIPATMNYTVSAGATLASNNTGLRGVRVIKNGTDTIFTDLRAAVNGSFTEPSKSRDVDLQKGDVLTYEVYQNSGGSLNLNALADTTYFQVRANPDYSRIGTYNVDAPPTIQKFTTGSGTYLTPVGVKYIRVRMVGGGGGGGASGTASWGAATAGGDTTFGSSLLTASGGGRGTQSTAGAPGSGTINSPAIGFALTGGFGEGVGYMPAQNAQLRGGMGGSTVFGGAGVGLSGGNGSAATANTGAGGGGGGASNTGGSYAGGGGSSGGYVEAIIHNPASSYSYTVGNGGSGGSAGTAGFAGAAGGSGIIIVEEYY